MDRQKFELKTEASTPQPALPISGGEGIRSTRPERRRKDSARLVWDSKPKRPPSPRDIEFQTAEVVIPNPARDAGTLPFTFRDGILHNEEIDRAKMNRLIWGDNLLAMQALLATGYEGKIDLIYIDPPFDSRSDYSHRMRVGGSEITREPSVIERLAYTDTWEAGTDSYLDMLFPRLQLMKRLMSDRGSLYLHLGPNISAVAKVLLAEVFGRNAGSIIWQRTSAHVDSKWWGIIHDEILFVTKGDDFIWNSPRRPYGEEYVEKYYSYQEPETGRRFSASSLTAAGTRNGDTGKVWRGFDPNTIGRHWSLRPSELDRLDADSRIYWPKKDDGWPRMKLYLDERDGVSVSNLWDDLPPVNSQAGEDTAYDTQKPAALLERIIGASSGPNSLVADFFCGSGTAGAVAEKLGRRWIMSDFGKVGIQVTRGRLVQQDAKPFLIENIGNYQREMIYLTGGRIGEMQRIILKLYGAAPHPTYKDLGVRGNAERRLSNAELGKAADSDSVGNRHSAVGNSPELVYVGYPDRPTTAKKVEEVARSAETLDGDGYARLVVLAWDYDYNFDTEWDARLKHAKRPLKTDVQRRMIPPDVYDYLKKAKDEADIEKLAAKIQFHEKPYLKLAKPKTGKKDKEGNAEVTIAIERYVLFDLPVPEKEQEKLRAAMKDSFAILIDYWAIDWNYDGATFKSQWQAIRGNGKKASIVPTSVTQALPVGRRTVAVRVVDVFGNDASAIMTIGN